MSSAAQVPNAASDPPETLSELEKLCHQQLARVSMEDGEGVVAYDKEGIGHGIYLDGDEKLKLSTNLYGINSKPNTIRQYRIEMFKKLSRGHRSGQLLALVKEGGRKVPDFELNERRQLCKKLYDAFVHDFPDIFGLNGDHLCFDLESTLYSLDEITLPPSDLELPESRVKEVVSRPYSVILRLTRLEDIILGTSDLERVGLGIARFFETATSRFALAHPEAHLMYDSCKTSYLNPKNEGFISPDMGKGKYLAAGASKTVALVEGPCNKGAAALVIDSKFTLFYHKMRLFEMCRMALDGASPDILSQSQMNILQGYIKGLMCFPLYGTHKQKPILLRGISTEDALQVVITVNGEQTSIAEYYKDRYGITLKFPQWPLAIGAYKAFGELLHYPIELLRVADNQRVGGRNISQADISTIIQYRAVEPINKFEEVGKALNSFSCDSDPFMTETGATISKNRVEIDGRILGRPEIAYANNLLVNPKRNGKWQKPDHAKAVRGGRVTQWAAVFLKVRGERYSFDDFKKFVERYYRACCLRGVQMLEVAHIEEIEAKTEALQEFFIRANESGMEFLIFGHSEKETFLHSDIKAFERKYSIITQCMTTSSMASCMGTSLLTLENIVSKTNVKLGGLNYSVTLRSCPIDSKILFIGLAMNHPAGGFSGQSGADDGGLGGNNSGTLHTNVSILGFSANDGINPNEFIGNFFFQPIHHDENITVLDKVLDEIFDRFKRNRKCLPSRVILYRSGCSESVFGRVIRYEMPVITAIVNNHARDIPITVIVPSREHSIRLFKQNIDPVDRSVNQNIQPGTIADRGITSTQYAQFYLNSHLAIKGTAKTPKYSVIYNTGRDVTLDMLERWTNTLCYNFQIVHSPVSLPAPVYIANRYAERGRQLFNTLPSLTDVFPGRETDERRASSQAENGSDPYYERSLKFNFTKCDFLRDKRINA